MKNIITPLLLIGALVMTFFFGEHCGKSGYKKELRASAGLDSSVFIELQSLDSLHQAQAAMFEAQANRVAELREKEQKGHALELKWLRSRPVEYVQVTSVKVAECDSAVATGESYRRQAELMGIERKELKEVIAIKEDKNIMLAQEVEKAEQRHVDDKNKLKDSSDSLNTEAKWKRVWRSVAITSVTTTAVILTIAFILL